MPENEPIKRGADGFTMQEAIAEAARCLKCKNPLCKPACPIENDIPDFMSALSKGNLGEAKEIIVAKSNLPAVCGRICPHEIQCEGHCILGKKGNAIKIGKIEQFIADFEFEMNLEKEKLVPKTRGKVAVVGSGPAGLTVAGDLARRGFHVTVYEAANEIGGILLYEIPEFRLPKYVVKREVQRIESLGVNFVLHKLVGEEMTVDDIFSDGYDAIFIGTGAPIGKMLDVPGNHLAGIHLSSYLLRLNHLYGAGLITRDEIDVDENDNVIVIGGGNVAMDVARTASRLGANSVSVLYHRGRENMAALKAEFEGAVEDGVAFIYNASTQSFVGENGTVTGLVATTEDGERTFPCTKVFIAVGSKPANRIVASTKGIDVGENGNVLTGESPYGMTTRKGVFAGGDVVHMPATVVLAMKEAKKVAVGIANYVDAIKLLGLESEDF